MNSDRPYFEFCADSVITRRIVITTVLRHRFHVSQRPRVENEGPLMILRHTLINEGSLGWTVGAYRFMTKIIFKRPWPLVFIDNAVHEVFYKERGKVTTIQ